VLNHWTFGAWILQAFYHAVSKLLILFFYQVVVVYFFTWYVCFNNGILEYHSDSLWLTATMLSSAGFVIVNLKAILEFNCFTWIHVIVQLFSFFIFYIFYICYSAISILDTSSNMYYIICKCSSTFKLIWLDDLFASGNFWLLHLLIIPACIVPDISFKLIKKHFMSNEQGILSRGYRIPSTEKDVYELAQYN
jgi:magnesium-transporting ATPase (P-type)